MTDRARARRRRSQLLRAAGSVDGLTPVPSHSPCVVRDLELVTRVPGTWWCVGGPRRDSSLPARRCRCTVCPGLGHEPQREGSGGDETAHRGLQGHSHPRRRAECDRHRLDHCAQRTRLRHRAAQPERQLSRCGGEFSRMWHAGDGGYETVAVIWPVTSPRSGGPDPFLRASVPAAGGPMPVRARTASTVTRAVSP